jgi:trk system potassium uptake protein TrkA
MKRFAVIGLGLFGWELAISLAEKGAEVIAIDKDIEVVDKIKEHVLIAVQMDSTNQQSLETQDLKNIDAAIVGIGSNFEESLLTVVILKQMGVPKVIARAGTHLRKTILENVGCDMVVLPEEDMGRRVSKILVSGLFLDRIEVGDEYSIVQLPAPQDFVGKKIVELHLREDYHVNIVTIQSRVAERNMWGKEVSREVIKAVPSPEDQISEGDILVLFGHDQDLDRLAKTFEKKIANGK